MSKNCPHGLWMTPREKKSPAYPILVSTILDRILILFINKYEDLSKINGFLYVNEN